MNILYPAYKQSLLSGDANSALTGSGTTGLWAALVDNSYTYSATHQYYSDLTGVRGSEEIQSVTRTNGVVDGDDIIYSGISGGTAQSVVLFRKNAGANTTWRLVAYLDQDITGLPLIPQSGFTIHVTWNAAGIFSL